MLFLFLQKFNLGVKLPLGHTWKHKWLTLIIFLWGGLTCYFSRTWFIIFLFLVVIQLRKFVLNLAHLNRMDFSFIRWRYKIEMNVCYIVCSMSTNSHLLKWWEKACFLVTGSSVAEYISIQFENLRNIDLISEFGEGLFNLTKLWLLEFAVLCYVAFLNFFLRILYKLVWIRAVVRYVLFAACFRLFIHLLWDYFELRYFYHFLFTFKGNRFLFLVFYEIHVT